jgi:hypothetical protein
MCHIHCSHRYIIKKMKMKKMKTFINLELRDQKLLQKNFVITQIEFENTFWITSITIICLNENQGYIENGERNH